MPAPAQAKGASLSAPSVKRKAKREAREARALAKKNKGKIQKPRHHPPSQIRRKTRRLASHLNLADVETTRPADYEHADNSDPPTDPSAATSDGGPRSAPISINELKKQLRQLTRFLSRPETSLPANVRVEKERELASLRETLVREIVRRERRATLAEYHMVRFFERQKAVRMIRRIKKELTALEAEEKEGTGKTSELKTRLYVAEVDLWYATHAPLEDPYPSLYPRPKEVAPQMEKEQEPTDDGPSVVPNTAPSGPKFTSRDVYLSEVRSTKPPLWHLVEKAVSDGSIKAVRDGKHPELDAMGLGEKTALAAKRAELSGASLSALKEAIAPMQDPAITKTPTNREKRRQKRIEQGRATEDDLRLEMEAKRAREEEENTDSDGGFFES